MKMTDPRIRVRKRHSRSDHRPSMFYPGGWRQDAIVYLDAIGRRNNGSTYRWLSLICAGDMGCPAQVLVRADLLDEMADDAIAKAGAR